MSNIVPKNKRPKKEGRPPTSSKRNMKKFFFTVDSALLRELGERLVGRPHIALAELIKNSYDADAHNVIVRFDNNKIEVSDNGHGMTLEEFENFWMRVGSPHKQSQQVSRKYKRPLTGSKGVGRLAVQFLANKIEVHTVSEDKPSSELNVYVDWNEAVKAGNLTKATAFYKVASQASKFPAGSSYGTTIVLSDLNQEWESEDFKNLAGEVWSLQPPFQSNPQLISKQQKAFTVDLESPEEDAVKNFSDQMKAVLDIWDARIIGRLINTSNGKRSKNKAPKVQLSLEFSDGTLNGWEYPANNSSLHFAQFEIRVFKLQKKQKYGIQVGKARDYFKDYGGVHVYDAGFHLPYYGLEHDWLDIEFDHSHRLTSSKLLPEKLQKDVKRGLNFLPTQSRLFGVVHVDTSKERTTAIRQKQAKKGQYLRIQVSRDRLVDNKAYKDLKDIVRYALDFYAIQQAKRVQANERSPVEPARIKFRKVDQVLAHYKKQIPKQVFDDLRENVQEAIDASESEAESISNQMGLLGSLATAGMSAIAYEHEIQKQYQILSDIARQLGDIRVNDRTVKERFDHIAARLKEWIRQAQSTRRLFSYLLDEQNREIQSRFKAVQLIHEVEDQLGILMRGIEIDTTDVDETLRLPEARFAEWSAIFQNVFINAVNAMLDSSIRHIKVSSRNIALTRTLTIQDTGSGVDLVSAEELFKPFIRKLKISSDRRALGLGGAGLGLAIVRMIADNINCNVSFVEPFEGFGTAFQISWSEKK